MPNKTKPDTKSPRRTRPQMPQTNGFITLWSLRILLQLGMFDRFIDRFGGFGNAEIMQSIGLSDFYRPDSSGERNSEKRRALKKQLDERLRLLLKSQPAMDKDDVFSHSIRILKKSLSLTHADIELLRFVISAPLNNGFSFMLDVFGDLNYLQTKHALATILNIALTDIERSLNAKNFLVSSGLLSISMGEGHITNLRNRFDLPEGIKEALSKEHKNDSSMLQCFFRTSPKARLRRKDFEHVQQELLLIGNYLKSAFPKKTKGVNILVYGDPGTGKTEFVRTLCAAEKFNLFEITMQNTQGAPLSGADRFATLQLSQKLMASKKHCVLLFDEIEDVFPNAEFNALLLDGLAKECRAKPNYNRSIGFG